MNVVILDRDGVINELVYRHTHRGNRAWASPISSGQVRLVPGAADAIKRLQNEDFYTYCVTDAMVAYGYGESSMSDVLRTHAQVLDLLAAEGVVLDQTFMCLHDRSLRCNCRKPGLESYDRISHLKPTNLWVVGDSDSDIQYGKLINAKTVSILSAAHHKRDKVKADHVAVDLMAAVDVIMEEL